MTRVNRQTHAFADRGYRSALAEPGRLGEPTLLESAGCAGRVVSSKRLRFEYRRNGPNVAFFFNGNDSGSRRGPLAHRRLQIRTCQRIQRHILVDGDQEAWRRRIIRIHFTKPYIGSRIPEISKILLAEEGSGILNFFLEGAIKLLQDCRSYGDIQLSARQQRLVDTMLAESDSLALYLQSAVTRVPYADGAGLATEEILQGYLDFCRKQQWNPRIGNFSYQLPKLMAKLFGASLTHNLQRHGKKNTRGYRMVAFVDDEPTEEDWH